MTSLFHWSLFCHFGHQTSPAEANVPLGVVSMNHTRTTSSPRASMEELKGCFSRVTLYEPSLSISTLEVPLRDCVVTEILVFFYLNTKVHR